MKIVLRLALLGILFSCSQPIERNESTVFRYNEYSGISSLDPAFARVQSNIWATHQIFNGLVAMNQSLEVVPAIAQSWEILDNGKTYVFTLRDDVFFHESEVFGETKTRKVVSNDFVYSFNRLQSKSLAAPGAWVLSDVDSIFATSDTTLVISLKSPFSPFLGLLTMKYCSVVPFEAAEAGGFSQNPIGTGPFYLKRWVDNEVMILRKNPLYFEMENGTRLPHLESVVISFIPDKQSAYMEFIQGRKDFLSGLDASYKDDLLTPKGELNQKYSNRFVLEKTPYLNTEYLAFYLPDSSVVSNPKVREAIVMGFDRTKMMTYLRNGIGKPAEGGIIPEGLPGFSKVKYCEYNPEKAARLLAEAGFPNGSGLPPISLYTTSNYTDLCEYIQGQLAQLGIEIRVEVTPPSTLREKKANGGLPFFRASWIADYPDAENYLSLFYSGNKAPNGPNYSHFENVTYDSLYSKARVETNDSSRIVLYQQLDSIIMSESPIVPLYYDEVVRVIPKGILGLEPNALNLLELKKVTKRE